MRGLSAAAATALGLMMLTGLAGPAAAGHIDPPGAIRATYEVGQVDFLQLSDDGHDYGAGGVLGAVTQDGAWNIGGVNWRLEPRHTEDNPPGQPSLSVALDADPDVAQVSVVDDVWGSGIVGGFFCNDSDDTHTCDDANPDERLVDFCGESPVVTAESDTDGDGRKDFGFHIFVVLAGPVMQVLNCPADATTNPIGATTGGVLDPAGGIYMTYS